MANWRVDDGVIALGRECVYALAESLRGRCVDRRDHAREQAGAESRPLRQRALWMWVGVDQAHRSPQAGELARDVGDE
jgi:hypothetical protein